ncbi:hypothetical protein [Nonomuraea sp. NPDC001831]|uniref:hypothetical protein n=1 Tax=Nonomuraea sp. NPDC001831 TaxID=3364340 RepID=UPI0036760D44
MCHEVQPLSSAINLEGHSDAAPPHNPSARALTRGESADRRLLSALMALQALMALRVLLETLPVLLTFRVLTFRVLMALRVPAAGADCPAGTAPLREVALPSAAASPP